MSHENSKKTSSPAVTPSVPPFSPLAIVGMSALFPKADDLQAYWANIKNGVDAITPIPLGSHWNAADYFDADPKKPDHTYAARGGFLSPVNFNPMEFGIAPKDIEATDTTQLLSLVAAQRALIDAGYAAGAGAKPGEGQGRSFDRERTSVILGVTGALELVIPLGARLGHPHWRRALKDAGVDADVAEDVVQRISDSYVGWQENSFPGLLGNVAAGRIANRLDIGGTNCVVDAACASSLAAIHLAALELSAGLSDMVITGGVDTFNDIFMYMCFSKTPALSPTGDAKPFDRDCDGTVLGEGIGVLVLKRLADAERDGDRIYAVLKGIGSSSDGRSSAIYAPRAGGQKLALQRAYASAGVSPDTLGLLEAHGTGTKVGDATELSALAEVFQGVVVQAGVGGATDAAGATGATGAAAAASASAAAPQPWCALGSVKSQIGHTKAAAGVAGMIKAALALHQKVLPPTIKVKQPLDGAAPGRSPFYVNSVKRPWLPLARHPRRAGVSALGFGGTNFHCVLEEHAAAKPGVDWDADVEIVAFSSDQFDDLKTQIGALNTSTAWIDFRRAAHASRASFKRSAGYRLVIVITAQSDRAALKDAALTMLAKHPEKTSWSAPAGIAFGAGVAAGKIGALFPGQGSQYPGMLRDLACQFPGMLDALTAANAVFASDSARADGLQLSDLIFPPPAFSDDVRAAHDAALKATEVAQPALGAVSTGAFNVLKHFGVEIDATCGHSYGELVALCGAGRITPDALHQLSNLRGRLMASRGVASNGVANNGVLNNGTAADRGAMLAVLADEATVQAFLTEEKSGLVIANRNAPQQQVLAGSVEQIHAAAAALTKRSIRSRVLQVSAAFHSALVADARAPFADGLMRAAISAGNVPVYSNSLGAAYPETESQARDVLANQIVRPVNFVQQIEAMHAAGVRTFVEIGPGHVLGDLVKAILPGDACEAIAMDSSKGSRSGIVDLALALGRLASLGHAVDLTQWENAPAALPANAGKPALTMPVSGANQRAPRPARPPTVRVPAVSAPAAQQHSPVLSSQMSQPAQAFSMQAPVRTATTPAASAAAPSREALPASLRAAEEGILALQRLQEQTAQLHKQFLEGQESHRRAIESLLRLRSDPAAAVMPISQVAPVVQTVLVQAPVPAPVPASVHAPARAPATHAVAARAEQKTLETRMDRPSPAHVAAPDRSSFERAVLDVVSDKTGYPAEMLNLGMGMDADLGIDSIKRVEIMAALRARLPNAPEIKPEHLGTLQTLEQVVAFLAASAPVSAASTALQRAHTSAAVAPSISSDTSADTSTIQTALLEVVAEKTGYPTEMLNLDMGLDADLGIDSIKRVEIMAALRQRLPNAPEIKPEHLGSLQTLQQIVAFLSAGVPQATGLQAAPGAVLGELSQAASSTAPSAGAARITDVLLAVVAEKTGYPVEMLNLDMGLDADLGIDSIKRVEIMASLRAQLPDAPEIKPEHLGSLQTLQQIVAFLGAGAVSEKSLKPAPTATLVATPVLAAGRASEVLLAVVAEKTGYPVEMLNLDMGLDADLGIDSIKRVEIMAALRTQLPGAPEIKPEHLGSLQTLKQIVEFLEQGARVAASAAMQTVTQADMPVADAHDATAANAGIAHASTVLRQLVRPVEIAANAKRERITLAAGAQVLLVGGEAKLAAAIEKRLKAKRLVVQREDVACLPSVPSAPSVSNARSGSTAALILLAPAGGCDGKVLGQLFRHVQAAGPALRKAGANGAAILVTVSRMDGAFGFGAMNSKADAVSGGLAGITKTARLEWPDVHCKALDLDVAMANLDAAAEQIVDEMFYVGPVEVGVSAGGRVTLEVETSVLPEVFDAGSTPPESNRVPLGRDDVVVISGGARGVTGDAAVALARASQATLVLLGRSELEQNEPEWARGLTIEGAIKKALFAHLPAGTTPATVEAQYRQLLAQREIRAQLQRITAAGARAVYRSVDVRDAAAVARVLADVRKTHGAIRGLVHGAGVLADRRIEDKTIEQFDAVVGTKVEGLQHLLAALAGEDLKVLALFSSYTGRFGRVGQVDYAAANEVLNKLAQQEARRRPACRVVSVNWGPWNGGMVTPGLRKVFEAEGVGLIEPDAGAEFLLREICAAAPGAVEVLALGATAGVPASAAVTAQSAIATSAPAQAAAAVSAASAAAAATLTPPASPANALIRAGAHVAFEREVSVAALPFLASHVINGRAVLPAALMVEWLAQAALHGNPGMRFHGLDDFKVLKGVVLDAGQSITVSLLASPAKSRDKLHVVPVQMVSQQISPNGERRVLHAQADVLLTEETLPAAPVADVVDMSGGAIAEPYSLGVLFHGVALQGIEKVEVCAERGVAALLKAASAPIKWMRNPLRGSWIADPLALDSAFQMMILWSAAHRGGPSLPSALGSYRQFVSAFPKGGCRAVIGVALGISAIAVASIQFLDRQGNLLASAEGCEFVVDAGLADAFSQNQLKLDT